MVDTRFSVAAHIASSLAYNPGKLLTSELLAESIRTNPAFIRRILSKMAEAGLVKTYKGKSGGVELARPATQVSLKDVYLAVSDKPMLGTPRKAAKKNCPVGCAMGRVLGDVIGGIEKSSLDYLATIHLSDLVTKIKEQPVELTDH